MNSSTTAAPLLIRRFRSCAAALSPARVVEAVGMMMPMQERNRREDVAWLAVALKVWTR
jgi:hypothetical protein